MIKMSRKAKKAMAVALTAGMLASTAATPVMAATEGWKKNSTGWWYQNADGSWPSSKWEKINGSWYYFDANGYMKANSWAQDKAGKWYYLGVNGAMKTNSWAQDKKGLWYYVGNDGAMVTNTWKTDKKGLWYHLGADGVMEAGKWITTGDKKYFLDADGVMQSGIITVEGKTYYLGAANDGSMKTGEVDIAGTKYNFGTDGACTDETAPAAAKHFDAKGNLVTPEIEVEKVAGITGEITNAVKDYSNESTNVVLAGDKAYFKVLVTGKNGKPVANTSVSVDLEFQKTAGATDAFELKGLEAIQTDANGYANFVIGAEDSDITATSGEYALYELIATATATNQVYKTNLAFAKVELGAVDVLNDNKDTDDLLVVPSTNVESSANVDSIPYTYTIDGKATTEYVATQQVNAKGTTTNKVKIALDPKIVIPYKNEEDVVDEYYQEVNQKIPEYSVYENGENKILVEDVPAGLKYATLNFASIDISDYTRVEIQAYEADTDKKVGKVYIIDGPTTQENFGYQIPVQKNKKLDIEVKVVSAGQVDDGQNAGLVVTNVKGIYDTKSSEDTKEVSLTDAVTWSVAENQYSNAIPMTLADAKKYINEDYDDKYTEEGNTFSYQLPVYPYSGNAILTVKDVNKKVIGYFTIPTVNEDESGKYEVNSEETEFQNENILVAPAGQAILVSKDEAFNKVGSIVANGNVVEVNSEVTGVTALEAKINLDSYSEDINLTNNTVYTSVHWSPIPTAKSVEEENFYALIGQTITVKAQLVDDNGNKVAQSGENVTYFYGSAENKIEKMGGIGTTKASASSYTSTTDENGQATLKITSGDPSALVDLLHAESDKYNVQLIIGETKVINANLRWVKPGLEFVSSVDASDVDYEVASTLKGDTTLDHVLAKDTGTDWIFGYKVVGETQDKKMSDEVLWDVVSIDGLKVDITKGGDGSIETTGKENGTANLTSTKAGATTLTGTIGKNSIVADTSVVFKVKENGKENTYTNVGEGDPSIDASLNLPITWGTVGTVIDVVTPKGKNVKVDGDPSTYEAYIRIRDTFQSPITTITTENVKVNVTYSDGINSCNEELTLSAANLDTANGLVKVSLKNTVTGATGAYKDANGDPTNSFNPTTATIAVKFGNVESAPAVVNYAKTPDNIAEFGLATAKYEVVEGANPQVKLYFTAPVNPDTLNVNMFNVVDNNASTKNVAVKSASVSKADNKVVILTLDDVHKAGLDPSKDYKVTVGSISDKGITYNLCDTHGRTVDVDYDDTIFDTVASRLEVSMNAEGEISFTINGVAQSTQSVLCVYDNKEENILASGETTKGFYEATASFTRNNTALIESLTVTFYYDGAVVTKQLTLTADETAAAAAVKAINQASATKAAEKMTELNAYNNENGGYIFLSQVGAEGDWKNYYAKAVTIDKDDAGIFEGVADIKIVDGAIENTSDDNKELKLKSTLVTDTKATATVTVTYEDIRYKASSNFNVTRKVTYNVTLVDKDKDEDGDADAIVFTVAK